MKLFYAVPSDMGVSFNNVSETSGYNMDWMQSTEAVLFPSLSGSVHFLMDKLYNLLL